MTYYWIDDRPLSALVLTPTRQGEPIDLTRYTGVQVIHVEPDGTTGVDSTAEIDDGAIAVTFGPGFFDQAGLHQLRLALTGADGVRERLDAVQIVVQDDDGWHTLPSARSEWRDAPEADERLWPLLEVAKQAVLAYAPPLADDQLPPINYRQAQLLQARNQFNAARVDPSGQAGDDAFTLTPFPLDWTVRQLLRPRTADPVVT